MLKTMAKTVGAGVLYHSGFLDRTARPALTVLGYHRVLDLPLEAVHTSPPGMVVTREMFEHQLAHAARHYRMVSLAEVEEACNDGRPLPRRACLVTFDDGWQDNYAIAYPILRRMGIPAAIFVATDYVGTSKVFWFTRLMRCLLDSPAGGGRNGHARTAELPADVARELDAVASLGADLRPWHLDRLIETMKRYPEPVIHGMVASLDRRSDGSPPGPEERLFLDWDEIREMDAHGIGIGSHSCSHRIMVQLSPGEAREELLWSRQMLEAQLRHPVRSFAFPNGDYDPAHMTMAWDVGYRTFFVSSRLLPGGPAGRVFPRPCVHDRVGRGPGGGFSPSLLELHLAGVIDRVRRRLPA